MEEKIGAFLTNSYANPKKFRSRKKKINFGLNLIVWLFWKQIESLRWNCPLISLSGLLLF